MGDIHIAGSFADTTYPATQPLFAGDTPPVVTRDVLIPTALGAIPKHTPLQFTAGAYAVWAAGAEIVGVTAYDIPDLAENQRSAIYTAGMFNIDAIAWPNGTTEDQVAAASVSSQCQFRKLLYSDKRVAKSGLAAGTHAPTAG